MMRKFTPHGLHLSGPRLAMAMSLIYYDAQIGNTVKIRPKRTKLAVKMNSECRNQYKLAFVSPQTVKHSPKQHQLPIGPHGSPSFPEAEVPKYQIFWLRNLFQWLWNAHNSRN